MAVMNNGLHKVVSQLGNIRTAQEYLFPVLHPSNRGSKEL